MSFDKIIYYILITIALLLACSIINFLVNRVVLKYITKYIKNNKYKWDDVLLDAKLFQELP